MKKKTIVWMVSISLIFILVFAYQSYAKAHTFTLSGKEEIQPITGTVTVTSPRDTQVVFFDVETGAAYTIPYITPGLRERISLEKSKWYRVVSGENLTMSPIHVRIQ